MKRPKRQWVEWLSNSWVGEGIQLLGANLVAVLIFTLEGEHLVFVPQEEQDMPSKPLRYLATTLTLGSSSECDLVVPKACPKHARVERSELGIVLSDLGSPEGTFLNGKRIVRARLQSGDQIHLAGQVKPVSKPQNTVLGSKTFAIQPIPDVSAAKGNLVGQQGLLHLSAALARPGSLESKLDEILDFSLRLGSFERASIWVIDPDHPDQFLFERRRQAQGHSPAEVSKTVLQQVLKGEALIIQDANLDQRVEHAASIKIQNIRTCVGLPLKTSTRTWGVLYLDSMQPKALGSASEQEFLGSFASLAAVAVENGWLAAKAQQEALFKDRLARFFPPATVNGILADNSYLEGAEMRVTILFCDIRNYTGISFEQPPRKVARWINDYFQRIVPIVFRHGGTLEKYIGDALLAIWGAPLAMSAADQALHSCRAAVEIHREVQEFAKSWPDLPCQVGIGIHHGPCYVGAIGHESYLQYAALGSTTNLSARLCSAAGPGETILSRYLAELLPSHEFLSVERPAVQAKGFPEVVEVRLLQRR